MINNKVDVKNKLEIFLICLLRFYKENLVFTNIMANLDCFHIFL